MIWHPHTDAPGAAENALIATLDDEGYPFLLGIAQNIGGEWVSEEYGRMYPAPFFWCDEAELVQLIAVGVSDS